MAEVQLIQHVFNNANRNVQVLKISVLTSLLLFCFVFASKSELEVGGLAVLGAPRAAGDSGKGKTLMLFCSF